MRINPRCCTREIFYSSIAVIVLDRVERDVFGGTAQIGSIPDGMPVRERLRFCLAGTDSFSTVRPLSPELASPPLSARTSWAACGVEVASTPGDAWGVGNTCPSAGPVPKGGGRAVPRGRGSNSAASKPEEITYARKISRSISKCVVSKVYTVAIKLSYTCGHLDQFAFAENCILGEYGIDICVHGCTIYALWSAE